MHEWNCVFFGLFENFDTSQIPRRVNHVKVECILVLFHDGQCADKIELSGTPN
jgi:hypothetical protein